MLAIRMKYNGKHSVKMSLARVPSKHDNVVKILEKGDMLLDSQNDK